MQWDNSNSKRANELMEKISDTDKFYEENKIGKYDRQKWGRSKKTEAVRIDNLPLRSWKRAEMISGHWGGCGLQGRVLKKGNTEACVNANVKHPAEMENGGKKKE